MLFVMWALVGFRARQAHGTQKRAMATGYIACNEILSRFPVCLGGAYIAPRYMQSCRIIGPRQRNSGGDKLQLAGLEMTMPNSHRDQRGGGSGHGGRQTVETDADLKRKVCAGLRACLESQSSFWLPAAFRYALRSRTRPLGGDTAG
jgi:hypothetical protein